MEEEENPAAGIMPDQLKEYLMQQGQAQGRPMYASNDTNPGMMKAAQSIKNAFGTPQAQAAPLPKEKKLTPNPYQNLVDVGEGKQKPKYFYSKSRNQTRVVHPDGTEEIVDGRLQPQ